LWSNCVIWPYDIFFNFVWIIIILQQILVGAPVLFSESETLDEGYSDPLEQFFILILHSCHSSNVINTLLLHIIIILLAWKNLGYIFRVTNSWSYIWISLNSLFKDIYYKNLNIKSKIFYFVFLYLFLIVSLSNLSGLIPYTYTITSFLVFDLYLVLTIFFSINLVGVVYHKWNMLNIIVPRGINGPILFSLIFFEIISYLARMISLTVRLFTNILSGHMLQHILALFSYKMFIERDMTFIIPFSIVNLITYLEALIAFLQAYVFLTLFLLYFNNVIYLH